MGSRKRTRPRLIGERQGQFDGGIAGQDMNGDQEAGMASPLPQELVDCNGCAIQDGRVVMEVFGARSEEHTSELQSLMRTPYAVFCLKKKRKHAPEHPSTRPITNQ